MPPKKARIYIGDFGKPEVLLVKISDQENTVLNKRIFAIGKGKVTAGADAFSTSTDQSIASLMQDE